MIQIALAFGVLALGLLKASKAVAEARGPETTLWSAVAIIGTLLLLFVLDRELAVGLNAPAVRPPKTFVEQLWRDA